MLRVVVRVFSPLSFLRPYLLLTQNATSGSGNEQSRALQNGRYMTFRNVDTVCTKNLVSAEPMLERVTLTRTPGKPSTASGAIIVHDCTVPLGRFERGR